MAKKSGNTLFLLYNDNKEDNMKKKICLLLIVILAVVCVPTFAEDENKVEENNSGFIAEDEALVQQSFGKTTFVVGNSVDMSSEVDGLNFVAGNNINLSSHQDYLFTAGNNLNLNGVSAKDIFVAGNEIKMDSANVRDVYVAGSKIEIKTSMLRNLYAGGDKVEIDSYIDGNVKISSENIKIGDQTVITGKLVYPKGAKIEISDGAMVENTETYVVDTVDTEELTFADRVSNFIITYVGLLIVALILFTINRRLFKAIEKEERDPATIFKTLAIGLGILVVVPIAAILALITVVGIPLTILSLILYGVCIYLSAIPTSYYVGKWVTKGKKFNDYLLISAALLVYYIIRLIPVVGGLVSFISLIFGLGFFGTYIIKSSKEAKK